MITNLKGFTRWLLVLLLLVQALAYRALHAQPAVYQFVTIGGRISPGSADGTNGNARFWLPSGIAADATGNVFVADAGNGTLRELTKAGTNWTTRTLAGLARSPGSADGTNTGARFGSPCGVAVDPSGNVFVADVQNATIRMLTPVGTNWVVSTIAGLAGDSASVDGTNQDIRFTWPTSVTLDPAGNLFIADYHQLRKLTHVGNDWISSTLTTTNFGVGNVNCVSMDAAGTLYVAGSYDIGNDGSYSVFARFEQSGTSWAGVELPRPPFGNRGLFQIAAGPNNTAFVSTWEHQVVWQIAWTGSNWVWSSVAGTLGTPYDTGSADGTNSVALFNGPAGMVVATNGDLFVCDELNNTVRDIARMGADWVTTTIAGVAPNLASADGTNGQALFSQPCGLAVDSGGNVYTADSGAHAIRLTRNIGGNWVTRTIAGLLGQPGSADGTNNDARLNFPMGIVAAPTGVLYVVDRGNHTIRKMEPTGNNWITTTIAGLAGATGSQDGTNTYIRFQWPSGIALDAAGSLYVTEGPSIRKLVEIGTNWVSSTLASGPWPNLDAVAVGADGTIYFTDDFGALHELKRVGTNWVSDVLSYSAFFESIALDHYGNIFFTDPEKNLVGELVHVGTNLVARSLGGCLEPIDVSGATPSGQALALGPGGDLYLADGNALWRGIRQAVTAPAPLVHDLVVSNGIVTCSWASTSGLSYQLQYCNELSVGAWMNLGNPIAATYGIIATTDAAVSNTQRFYRVVLLP